MKISKLFHWLYAILMMLPIFAIGSTILYTTFNKNAFESYYGETINEEQSKTTSFNNLEYNVEYTFSSANIPYVAGVPTSDLYIKDFEPITTYTYQYPELIRISMNTQYNVVIATFIYENQNITYLNLTDNTLSFKFKLNGEVNKNSLLEVEKDYVSFNYIEYNKFSYLDNSFYYAVDKVESSPMFSWAYNSFLVAPFQYIMNLFGVPSNHVIVELLSYWLAVSIIWLIFDVVMYVPLLAHRWLDKGVIE